MFARARTLRGDCAAAAAWLLALVGCSAGEEPAVVPGAGAAETASPIVIEVSERLKQQLATLSPLPPPPPDPTNRVADDPDAALLGQALFFDERLSLNGSVSCATCHDPARGFTDGRQLAVGISEGNRHSPTLWNVAFHRWLTWDGRADSLWMQALDPLEDPREMGTTRVDALRVIHADAPLRDAYSRIFGPLPTGLAALASARPARRGEDAEGSDAPETVRAWSEMDAADREAVTRAFTNVGKAIAAYQRTLVRGGSPFDTFVEGVLTENVQKQAALSPAAQRGLVLFLGRANCTLCHSGPNFSDGEFHNNALPTLHGGEPRDPGRYEGSRVVAVSEFNAAGPYSDAPEGDRARRVSSLRQSSEAWGEFRTPSLRNLAQRAPFMHQGQFETLDHVLGFYSELVGSTGRNHHQEQILVPLRLSEVERSDLLAFLASLEGQELPSQLLQAPFRLSRRAR